MGAIGPIAILTIIGLVSGGYAVVQIYNRRRKNRIDGFYADVMAIRDSIDELRYYRTRLFRP